MQYLVRLGAAVRAFSGGPLLEAGTVIELDAEGAARLVGQVDPLPPYESPSLQSSFALPPFPATPEIPPEMVGDFVAGDAAAIAPQAPALVPVVPQQPD